MFETLLTRCPGGLQSSSSLLLGQPGFGVLHRLMKGWHLNGSQHSELLTHCQKKKKK